MFPLILGERGEKQEVKMLDLNTCSGLSHMEYFSLLLKSINGSSECSVRSPG